MKNHILTFCFALALAVLGIFFSYYKWDAYQFPLLPKNEFKSWYVELSAKIDAPRSVRNKGMTLSVIKPKDSSELAVANPQLISDGYGVEETADGYTLSKRKPKAKESFLLRFSLYDLDFDGSNAAKLKAPKSRHRYHPRNRVSNADEKVTLLYATFDKMNEAANAHSSGPVSLAQQLVKWLDENTGEAALILDALEAKDRVDALQQLLHINGVNARIVNGFELEDVARSVSVQRWLEIADDGTIKRFFPDETKKGQRFYAWWYGNTPPVSADKRVDVTTNLAIKSDNDGAFTRSLWLSQQKESLAYYLALQTLPLQQQLVLQVLLLLPLGALIVAFFRQIIGVQTFGTFMPVLIAIALRETGLVYGIVFFTGIILIGLMARGYIEKLQLLMVSRLSAVLCIVVLAIVCFMLLNKNNAIPLGISVALFPVVIIVMFIERMSTMIEETGMKNAVIGCAGSIAIASIIYFIIMQPVVQHFVFTFPEHILIVLACCILIGRYNGFKLSEYWRFRHIQKQLNSAE